MIDVFAFLIVLDATLIMCAVAQVFVTRRGYVEDLAVYRLQALMLDRPVGPCVAVCPCVVAPRLRHKGAVVSTPYRTAPSRAPPRFTVARLVLVCVVVSMTEAGAVVMSGAADFATRAGLFASSAIVVFCAFGRARVAWVMAMGLWATAAAAVLR